MAKLTGKFNIFDIRVATEVDLKFIQSKIIEDPEDIIHMDYTGFYDFDKNGIWNISFVGEINGEVVGEVAVEFRPYHTDIYINGIYVLKEHRKKGYGELLLKHAINHALQSWNGIFLYGYTIDNEASGHLLQKLGFKKKGVYRDFVYRNKKFYDQTLWIRKI